MFATMQGTPMGASAEKETSVASIAKENTATKPLCTESAEVEDGLKVLLKFKYYSRMMFS